MDKKQCERMFEQMQPPEAVVQRLQQRIHAEEAASLAEQQPNRSIQTLHTTTAPPPPKRIRCSWQKFSGGVDAAVLQNRLLKHLKHQKQPNHLFCSIRDRICRKWRLSIRTG